MINIADFRLWATAAVLLGAPGPAPRTAAPAAPPFRAAVEGHLAAIARRDMSALLPTLTTGTALTMIGPNGYRWETRQQYVDFHTQWFATKDDGKLTTEIVRVIESPALGHALIKYRYTSKDKDGKAQAIDSWLALTFALEGGQWHLVFDQNTLIAP
jgi:ketosteroid isomerase-like protein